MATPAVAIVIAGRETFFESPFSKKSFRAINRGKFMTVINLLSELSNLYATGISL